jgi:hypothetical protein
VGALWSSRRQWGGYQLIYTSWAAISKSEWDYARNTWDFLQNRFIKGTERVIPGHGISVSVRDVLDPGAKFYTLTPIIAGCVRGHLSSAAGKSLYYMLQDDKNGLISAEIEYADPTKPWLTGFNPKASSSPWLDAFREAPSYPDKCFIASTAANSPYPSPPGSNAWTLWYDFNKNVYRDGLLGAWGPYGLVTPYDGSKPEDVGIGFGYCPTIGCVVLLLKQVNGDAQEFVTLERLPSMEIVITPDPSKWSRCLVIEASPTPSLVG